MENSNGGFVFVLYEVNDTKTNKQMYFALGLVLYTLTLCVNVALIIIVIVNKTLHKPMYLFTCSLYVNGIFGASAFYPKALADLLLDFHVISYTGCLAQIFIIFWYAFCEFTCLTVMGYDRYIAICKPLEYHYIMTQQKVVKLLFLTWTCSFLETFIGIVLTARLPLCGNNIDKLFCFNWDVVKLSCIDITPNNIYGYCLLGLHVFQALFIVNSYIQIIRASLRSKTQRVKFMQTCLPHLITLINFSFSMMADSLSARYGKGPEFQLLRNILGMEFVILPPLLNPIIYGLKVTQIRNQFVRIYSHKINTKRALVQKKRNP